MSCGCNKNKTATSPASKPVVRSLQPASAPAKDASSGVSAKVEFSEPKKITNPDCKGMYDILVMLDRKSVALHNKFRFSQMGFRYAETQKIIRGMIINLKHECPDEDDFGPVRDFINSEYSKYFSVNR